jgi:hypothetical protein
LSFYFSVSQISFQDEYQVKSTEAGRRFAPLVYMDTGDLVMNKIIFVDYWGDLFELYIHEDAEWWQEILPIVIIIVAFVLAYFQQYWAAAELMTASEAMLVGFIAGMGAVIGVIGAMSGNKWLQAIGAILTLGSATYTGYIGALTNATTEAGKTTGTMIATEAAKNVTISGMVEYAFTEMTFDTFLSLFNLYKTLNQKEFKQAENKVEPTSEKTSDIKTTQNDDEFTDNVLQIAKLHEKMILAL